MTEKQARRYFNKEARWYERGLPPNREDTYAIALPQGGSVAAPSPEVLWERFWNEVREVIA